MSALQTQVDAAHRLAERHFEHPLISVFIDLDRSSFATAPARATEIGSLLDSIRRQLRELQLDPVDKIALEDDADRLERYLRRDLEVSGVHGIAIYCSQRADLFETVSVTTAVSPDVMVEPLPRLEPLLPEPGPATVCVALVSRREARLFLDERERLVDELDSSDQVRGQHRRGGRSQANYERSVEADVYAHLRRTAESLQRLLRREPFERLLLGGPHELVARFAPMLHADLRAILDPKKLSLDVHDSTVADVEGALAQVRRGWHRAGQDEALQGLLATLNGRPRAAHGLAATLAALDQHQVATLVLAPRLDVPGAICPNCEQLYSQSEDFCPADGTQLGQLPSLRSAMIRAALRQDAKVIVLTDFAEADRPQTLESRPETEAFSGIGALLRY